MIRVIEVTPNEAGNRADTFQVEVPEANNQRRLIKSGTPVITGKSCLSCLPMREVEEADTSYHHGQRLSEFCETRGGLAAVGNEILPCFLHLRFPSRSAHANASCVRDFDDPRLARLVQVRNHNMEILVPIALHQPAHAGRKYAERVLPSVRAELTLVLDERGEFRRDSAEWCPTSRGVRKAYPRRAGRPQNVG